MPNNQVVVNVTQDHIQRGVRRPFSQDGPCMAELAVAEALNVPWVRMGISFLTTNSGRGYEVIQEDIKFSY